MITEKEIKEILLRYSTEFLGHETIDESSYYDYADDINELLVKKLTIPDVGSTFAIEFAQYIAENHYRLVNVLDGWYHWQDEYGIKTTQELLKDFEESRK